MNGTVFLEEKPNFCGNFVNFTAYPSTSSSAELKDITGALGILHVNIVEMMINQKHIRIKLITKFYDFSDTCQIILPST